jgi:NHLM bacteriocin system ABC transporter peptidase/ATP-binding protein
MILQMESVECGAAALAIILAYYKRIVPLATLRRDCGVSRDGSKCSNILKAAQTYGMTAKAYKRDLAGLSRASYPYIVFWNFNHFLVVEGYRNERVYLNDPATGPRWVTIEEFDRSYTGVMVSLEPGPEFRPGGSRPSTIRGLWSRLSGSLPAVFAAVCAALLLVAPGLAIPALMAAFVDRVLVEGLADWGRPLVLGLLISALLRWMLSALEFRILRRLQIRLAVANSARFVRHLLRLPASFYAQRYAGEISSRIALNDNVAELLSGRLATASIDVLLTVFYVAVMWRFSRPLTLAAVAFAVLNFLVLSWISRRRKEGNVRLGMAIGKSAGVGIAGLQSIRTLKASALESDFFARWAGFFANLYNAQQELSVLNFYLGALPPFLFALMTVVILVAGGFEVVHGRMSVGMLVAFQTLAASFLTPVNNLVGLGASIQQLESDMSRLDDVLSSPAQTEPLTTASPDRPVRLRGHVEFRNVTFGYSPVNPPLISGLCFTVKPGQRIAFVGESGSGKSTIAKLLAGLYIPNSGEILLDGTPMQSIPREILANSMALVDQDILLFQGSVRDNLTLWDVSTPEESVRKACRDAEIDSAIAALPEGFSSELLEDAANLSGGQRQRLEIARALAADPSLLIMDEATNALDSETELLIDRNIRARGCTCFIVAHRLSTVRDSDEIIVLHKGVVVERGTHDELMARCGRYAELLAQDEDQMVAKAAPIL